MVSSFNLLHGLVLRHLLYLWIIYELRDVLVLLGELKLEWLSSTTGARWKGYDVVATTAWLSLTGPCNASCSTTGPPARAFCHHTCWAPLVISPNQRFEPHTPTAHHPYCKSLQYYYFIIIFLNLEKFGEIWINWQVFWYLWIIYELFLNFSYLWRNLDEICRFFENFVILLNCSSFFIFFNYLLIS